MEMNGCRENHWPLRLLKDLKIRFRKAYDQSQDIAGRHFSSRLIYLTPTNISNKSNFENTGAVLPSPKNADYLPPSFAFIQLILPEPIRRAQLDN